MAQGIFANTAFEGSIPPEVAVQQPVQDDSASIFVNSVSQGVKNAGNLFEAAAKERAAGANSAVLTSFQEDVNLITDAMEQGMSVQEGRMRLRKLNSEYVSNYPSMLEDINKLQGTLTSTVGLADIIKTGNEQEQVNRKIAEEAAVNGWPNVETYKAYQAAANQYAITDTQYKQAQAEYGIITQADKTKGYSALKDVVNAGLPWVDATMDKYQALIDGGTPVEEAIAAARVEVAKGTAFIQSTKSSSAGAEGDVSYLLTGIETRLKAFEEYNNGSITKEIYQTRLDTSKAQDQLTLRMSNPRLAKLAAASEMLGPVAGSVLVQQLTEEGVKFAIDLEQPVEIDDSGKPVPGTGKPVDVIQTNGELDKALSAIKDTITKVGSTATPEQNKAIGNTLSGILRGVKRFGGTAESPVEFNSVINTLADPAVGAWIAKNGLPSNIGPEASYVVEQQYGEVLAPLIRTQWDEVNLAVQNFAPTGDRMTEGGSGTFIQPVWNGSAVEFRAMPGFENNPNIQAQVDSLNSGPNAIAPPLNTLIRAQTHMNGSTDYKAFYEANLAERLFGPASEAPSPSTDGPKGQEKVDVLSAIPGANEVTLEELAQGNLAPNAPAMKAPSGFVPVASTVGGKTGALLDAIGKAEGADYNTLYGYAEKRYGVDITDMTIAEVRQLQNKMVKDNGISSAVGKYQVLRSTLNDAIKALGIKPTDKFTPELQDKIAQWLLQSRTNYAQWLEGKGDVGKFQNGLASIWASVPNLSGVSQYAGDGVNKATGGGQALLGML